MPMTNLSKAARFWPNLADTIFIPRTEAEYNRLVAMLDELIDEVGEDESHPLASLMEVLGVLIEQYENVNVPELA
jgi:HTH-type transcriptional regulator / antitoxin HigA